MKIKKIKIENFRSVKNCTINISNVCALVGENNSGKSSVLRALNAFFNFDKEESAFIKYFHQYSPKSRSRIELTFVDVPNKNVYHDKISNNELIIRMIYSYSKYKKTLQYKKNGYKDLKLDFLKKLSEDISFVCIPPNRGYSQLTIFENTVLKQVLEEYLKQRTSKRDTLTPKVIDATNNLAKLALSKIEKDLQNYYSLNHNFKFKFEYDNEIDYSLLLNDLYLKITEFGKSYAMRDCGSGIQSMTIIALYKYLANLRHNNFILGIEEPETNLHPQAQRELINAIKGTNGNSKEIQVIFTSHSAVIADQLDHDELVLFRREPESNRGFKTVSYQVPNDFWNRHNLEEFKYYQFYKYRNSEFFFAKFIIVVESKNEAEVIKYLLNQCKIDSDLYGVSIINLEGVKNLKYPYYLLSYLKIPNFLILDKDYFIPYSNDELKSSRYESGFPKYRFEYKSNTLTKELISKQRDRERLLHLLKTNHSKTLDFLERFNMICFKYTLEIDLVASVKAETEFYNVLHVPQDEQSKKNLLVERYKQIKKPEILLGVLKNVPHKNLPNSYKRIKKVLSRNIKATL